MKRIFFFVMLIHLSCHSTQKAVINVPIADLIGNPIESIRPHTETTVAYDSIALCGGQINSPFSCPRLHQLLYNDVVEIVKTHHNEVCIRTTHAFYITPSLSTPQTHYWTLKKNITLLDDITNNNISLQHIPNPITFANNNNELVDDTAIVTLQEPYYCSSLKKTLSAGTRFVRVPTDKKKHNHTTKVYVIDYATMREHQIQIPNNKCMLTNQVKSHNECITDYVNLLKKWINSTNGCIPYVWGGTSFSHATHGPFKEITQITNNSDYSFYQYAQDTSSPKSGFDCSGVILRATQICGIPYFCKNTTTIAHCLKPLQPEQQLMEGDLILIRGHVMVVSDISHNLLIEARSYAHGYGKLQEIALNEVFDGITTYKDLCDIHFNKKPIKRKDKHGKIRDTFANLQLFSMLSTWDNQQYT